MMKAEEKYLSEDLESTMLIFGVRVKIIGL